MSGSGILVALLVLFVVLVLLEGRRQRRRYGRGTGRAMMRAGLLELQRQLEPERKLEVLVEERREPESDAAGDPPVPGGETGASSSP